MVTLKKLTTQDLDYFWIWGSDPRVTQSLFWDAYESKDDASRFLASIVEPHPFFKAICYNGNPVGAVTLDQGKGRGNVRAELGYVIAKDYWGQGMTTKAVLLAIEDGFKELEIVRIESFVDPDNIGSIRVLEKAGLQKEGYLKKYLIHRGEIRDRIVYGITRK